MKPITRDSTREEVLAAAAEHEQLVSDLAKYDEQIDFRGDPPEKRRGCYSSKDGMVIACYGGERGRARNEPYHVVAQRRAGEEDQTDGAPEWGA